MHVLPDYKVTAATATTSKVVRAQPFLAAAEAGKIKLLKIKWNDDWLDEFEDFPDGNHDDQIDTCAIGYNAMLAKKSSSPVWGRKTPNLSASAQSTNPSFTKRGTRVTGATWGSRRK